MVDSISETLAAYQDRFGTADRDSLQRFEAMGGKRSAYDGALTMFWKHLPQGWKVVGGHSSSRTDSEP
jgi:hypothetical protein